MQKRSFNGFYGRNTRFRYAPRRANQSSTIHESKFIKKATDSIATVDPILNTKFADLQIDSVLKRNILSSGFVNLTSIQNSVISHIFDGKDVIGIANTGTGKTAAFLIPLLDKVVKDRNKRTLVIVPTRELAVQIREELRRLSMGMNIYSSVCIGGSFIRSQIYELQRNPHFVIGTPGRLKDLIERKNLNLANFNTIVLDEVDRMLDMGFVNDIKFLLSLLPQQRQSLFFSATISPVINRLIETFARNPIMVSVKKEDTAEHVDQDIIRVQNGSQKIDVLEGLLKKDGFKKVLIFGRTKRGVERLSVSLFQRGFKVISIHGDKPQSKRTQAIRLFKEDVVNILVATDVASRGIDIVDITHVINYDKPATYEDYIHRIGRTGRANKKGIALTFVD